MNRSLRSNRLDKNRDEGLTRILCMEGVGLELALPSAKARLLSGSHSLSLFSQSYRTVIWRASLSAIHLMQMTGINSYIWHVPLSGGVPVARDLP